MTMTVKLDPLLEEQLRQRANSTGSTASDVIRAALQLYLSQVETAPLRSAFALGAGLFGQHRGAPGLAQNRKQELVQLWGDKAAKRGR